MLLNWRVQSLFFTSWLSRKSRVAYIAGTPVCFFVPYRTGLVLRKPAVKEIRRRQWRLRRTGQLQTCLPQRTFLCSIPGKKKAERVPAVQAGRKTVRRTRPSFSVLSCIHPCFMSSSGSYSSTFHFSPTVHWTILEILKYTIRLPCSQ